MYLDIQQISSCYVIKVVMSAGGSVTGGLVGQKNLARRVRHASWPFVMFNDVNGVVGLAGK
jgi:hypothetical protein